MADFSTHLTAGVLVSGTAASALMLHGPWSGSQIGSWFLLGLAGSLLPDIDADASAPVRIAFTVAAIGAAFAAVFLVGAQLGLAELGVVWATVFFATRYGLFHLFTRLTVHRGIIHSLPAAGVAALLVILVSHYQLDRDPVVAWTDGAFLLLGYLTHLCLDELYSVDLLGTRVRRSFGTALKPLSLRNVWGSVALYGATVALYWTAPDPGPFVASVGGDALLQRLASLRLIE